MLAWAERFWKEEEGQGMAEYGLILALVALVVAVALTALSGSLNDLFGRVEDELAE